MSMFNDFIRNLLSGDFVANAIPALMRPTHRTGPGVRLSTLRRDETRGHKRQVPHQNTREKERRLRNRA